MKTELTKTKSGRIYNIHFYNITDLYDYIKSNPQINKSIFTKVASSSPKEFYGVPLPQATEYLLGGYEKGFDNFLLASKDLKTIGIEDNNSYHFVRSVYGNVPIIPLIAAGVPDCMLARVVDDDVRVVNIQFSLSYPATTKDDQIINRGLATLFIVQALEEKGYIVNFNAFQISQVNDEIIYITINLKQPSDLFLNMQKCYYPIRAKEFLRRILFRVLESSDVTNRSWGENYGHSLSEDKIREFLKREKPNFQTTDLIIADPINMGITGNNIYADTLTMIKKLGVEKEFDTDSLQRKIRL